MPSERVQRRIDGLLDDVEVASGVPDWDRVRELCDAVLRLDPDNSDARLFLEAAERDTGVLSADEYHRSDPLKPAEISQPPEPAQFGASPDSEPTSFANGRYTVKRFLGEGGKKKVYLATDTVLDRDVAFALIKTDGLDEVGRERIKREAQAMGRMGTHPQIMPIYDLGEEVIGTSTQPFMVQPLMGGGDVEGLIEDANGPLELETAIKIATETAQGLVFAHSRGIVHRDLKPGNVWMDEDGAAKIGDFGLAVATDRSRLTVEKMMVGTVNYMPPEQATGGELTPRADLYSLGAMMYEMCTGRVPFMGDDDIAVISQHVNTPPVAPSWHNGKIPRALDSLILRMMAKDPEERPESAAEVLTALGAIDLSVTEERDEDERGSLDSMAGGVFVGRQREMDQLKSVFEEVLSGRGRMVTLVGEPGIGKTRTAQELATYAGMRGAEVLWGRSYESGGAPPYWPWVQAIRAHVSATDETTLRSQLGSAGPVIAEVVSDIREKLPDLPEATRIEDPESARFRLFDSISTFLKNVSSSTPLVLMLEDLHWADKPSLMLLEFVARELANSKIMIVGNYRDVELNRRHPLSVTLGDLSRERLFERVVLRGLQRQDVERFIEIAAGISPPSGLVDTVHTQTEGNPLFVTETVRLLIQEGQIETGKISSSGTSTWEIRIPEGVREVIGRRLDRLSERCNEVLTIAAVIGRQFRFDVVKMLVEDTTEGQLLDVMDEALSARIIEEMPTEVGLYQFTHSQLQETLTLELSANRRVRMHARIAEALERYYGDEAEANATELVGHFAEAEVVLGADRLAKYSVSAGEQSLDGFAWEAALGHFDTAIDVSPATNSGLLGRAWVGLGLSQLALVQMVDGFVSLLTGVRMLRETNDIARIRRLAHLPYGAQSSDAAIELHEILLEATPEHSSERAYVLGRAAVQKAFRNHMADSLEALQTAKAISNHLKSDDLVAWTNIRIALIDYLNRNYAEAQENANSSLKLSAASGDDTLIVNASFWTLMADLTVGRTDRADRLASRAVESANTLRDRFRISQANGISAVLSLQRGEFAACVKNSQSMAGDNAAMLRCTASILTESGIDQSRLDETRHAFIEFARSMPEAPGRPGAVSFVASVGWVAVQTGDQELLKSVSEFSKSLLTNCSKVPRLVYEAHVVLAMEAMFKGDISLADQHIAVIEQGVEVIVAVSSVQGHKHLVGQIAAGAGNHSKADRLFEEGAADLRLAGFRPGLALTLADHADLLIERPESAQREKVVRLQDEAISIARELGMQPLLERVLVRREILKA